MSEARLARATAVLAAVVGVLGLLGWLTSTPALYAPLPNGGELKIESAIALTLLAIALLLGPYSPPALTGAAGLAAVSFAEYFGLPGLHSGPHAQMPLATAVCVLLLVLSAATPGRPLVRQLSALAASAIGGLVLVGFAYGTRTLTKFSHSSMSVLAAVAVVLISVALLARTQDGWMEWVWHGSDAGAVALRRTLGPVVLGLPVLTFLHMQGERIFWRDQRVAEAGYVVLLTVLVSALLFRVAFSLRLLDLQREQARRDLVALNVRLANDVSASYATLHSARQRIGSLEDSQRAILTVHDDVLQTLFASGLMLRTTLDAGSSHPSAQDTLDSMDEAMRAIRRVVEDLNDQLGGTGRLPT